MQLFGAEPGHHLVALSLRKIAVQSVGIVTVGHKLFGNLAGFLTGTAKYNGIAIRIIIGNPFQRGIFIFGVNHIIMVLNVFGAGISFSDREFERVVQVFRFYF